jgi:hypothetical protein
VGLQHEKRKIFSAKNAAMVAGRRAGLGTTAGKAGGWTGGSCATASDQRGNAKKRPLSDDFIVILARSDRDAHPPGQGISLDSEDGPI